MSTTSFLFNGQPPADINTTSSESATLPNWYQEYLQGLMGTSNALAATPYPQFNGPLLAPFNDTQNQAFSMTGALPGVTSGATSAASGALGNAANVNIPGAVQPYVNSSTSAANNPSNALNPYLNTSSGLMDSATQAATPGGIQSYLNPYQSAVSQNLMDLGQQSWNNTIMPSVQNEFISGGQFGSGRNAQVLGQAANTFQTNLEGQIANSLEAGYNTAGNQAATQAGILGASANTALQQGTAAGAAAGQEAGIQQSAGALAGNAAQQQGALSTAIGSANTSLANTEQGIGLQNAAAEQTVGNQEQAQTQDNLTTAYNQFQSQAAYPEQQATFMSDIIRGLQSPGTQTSINSNQAPSPFGTTSPSIGNTLSTLFSTGGVGKAAGGMIKGYAAGGQVSPTTPIKATNLPPGAVQQPNGDIMLPPAVAHTVLAAIQASPLLRGLLSGVKRNANGSIIIPYELLEKAKQLMMNMPAFQNLLKTRGRRQGVGTLNQNPSAAPQGALSMAPMAGTPPPQGALSMRG